MAVAVAVNVLFPTALSSAAKVSWSLEMYTQSLPPSPPPFPLFPCLDSVSLPNTGTTSIRQAVGAESFSHSVLGCGARPER